MYIYIYTYWICLRNRKPRYLKSLPPRNWQDLEPRRVLFFLSATVVRWIPWSFLRWMWVNCNGLSIYFATESADTGFRYWPWAMSHVFLLNILNGVPQITQVFHSQVYPKSAAVTPPALGGLHQKRLRCRRSPKPTFKTSVLVKCYQPDWHLVNKWAGPPQWTTVRRVWDNWGDFTHLQFPGWTTKWKISGAKKEN